MATKDRKIFLKRLSFSVLLCLALTISWTVSAAEVPKEFLQVWQGFRQALVTHDLPAIQNHAVIPAAKLAHLKNEPDRQAESLLSRFPAIDVDYAVKFQQTEHEALLVLAIPNKEKSGVRLAAHKFVKQEGRWKLLINIPSKLLGKTKNFSVKERIQQLVSEAAIFDLFKRQLHWRIENALKNKHQDFDKGLISDLTEKPCRKLSNWQGNIIECWLQPLANGSAAKLVVQTECGGDSCDWEEWMFADNNAEPLTETFDELSADHRIGFRVEIVVDPHTGETMNMHTNRINRTTNEISAFAKCFSPVLSPGGRWILCRDRNANVLRVPIEGGKPEVVIDSGLEAADIYWVSHAYIYPGPIRFEDKKMFYTILLSDAINAELEAKREQIEREKTHLWSE